MRYLSTALIFCVLAGCAGIGDSTPTKRDVPRKVVPQAIPEPVQPDCPDGKCPWVAPKKRQEIQAKVGGDVSPDGTERMQINYDPSRHRRNTVGTDGKGLCVFNSISHSGDWQGDKLFYAMFDYMKKNPGGGYPSKVDEYLKRCSRELGLPVPEYIQVQDGDPSILQVATRNRLMPAVTYGVSPTGRYNGQTIAHMVNVTHATNKWYVVMDNNYPGTFEWMSPQEFRKSYNTGSTGWSVILLTASPPPPPKSKG